MNCKFFAPCALGFVFLFATTGCVRTQYQKQGFFSGGYSDFRTGKNSFKVSFNSNRLNKDGDVLRYSMLRAAEIAVQHGFDYFKVIRTCRLKETGSVVGGRTTFIVDVVCSSELNHDENNDDMYQAVDFIKYNSTDSLIQIEEE